MMKYIFSILTLSLSAYAQNDCNLPHFLDPFRARDHFLDTRFIENIEQLKKDHPCKDIYAAICNKDAIDGKVEPAVAIYEQKGYFDKLDKLVLRFMNEWNKIEISKRPTKEDFLAQRLYEELNLDDELDKWDHVLKEVKQDLFRKLKSEHPKIDQKTLETIIKKINAVTIRRSYKYRKSSLFTPGAEISYENLIITVGGLNLLGGFNFYDAYSTIGHEIGHIIADMTFKTHTSVKECIAKRARDIVAEGYLADKEEIWCDWIGAELVAERISRESHSPADKKNHVYQSMQKFCGYGGSKYGHPPGRFRVEHMRSNKVFSELLCSDFKGNMQKKEYCE